MKTILASEIPGMLDEFGAGSQPASTRTPTESVILVNKCIYDWAEKNNFNILSLFYFKISDYGGFDFVVNYTNKN
jgi:hypothetical protein